MCTVKEILKKSYFSLTQRYLFFFFLLLSISLRFFSFFPTQLGHDESTYMLIGRSLLNGQKLYTDVFDTKPAGIFLFYAALEFLFGGSIFLKRLVFAVVVAATSYFIAQISKRLFNGNKIAIASGIIYIFYTSIWNYHGRSPNTELLFNFCTILGLFFFLKPKNSTYFLGGLVIGIGFMIKYLVLFDLFAFLVYFFVLEMIDLRAKNFLKIFIRYAVACIAFLLPFALTNLFFWLGDNFNDFYYITYEMPSNYGGSPSLTNYSIMLLELLGKFFPITFFIFFTILNRKKQFKIPHLWFLLFWVFCVLIAIYLPGKEFSHYTIQLMLPLSLIAGFFFHPEFKKNQVISKLFSGKIGISMLIVVFIVLQVIGFKDDILKPDYNLQVVKHIDKDLSPEDEVYIGNYEQIIYYLLDIDSPTKFVHSSLLFSPIHSYLPVNREEEIRRIINKSPKYVLIQRENALLEELIQGSYYLDATFRNKEILVYKLQP